MKISFQKIMPIAIIIFVLGLNLFLGLSRLGQYSAVDEPYWTYDRTPDFWNAIAKQKWSKTDINDKPGITVAILSGIGLIKSDPLAYKSLRDEPKTDEQLQTINAINFNLRLPIFLFYILSLPFFYFFLRKLFEQTTAILGFIFIGLSPIILGITLIINPDSLLWIFATLSVLAYLIFQKNEEKKYLYFSGVLLGLALLTKYVANILYVFFLVLPFLEYIFIEKKPPLRNYLQKFLKDYAVLILISMLTFFILYPATWKDIDILWKGTFLSDAFKKVWPLFAFVLVLIFADIVALKQKVTGFILNSLSRYSHLLMQFFAALFLTLIVFIFLDIYLGMKPFDFEGVISSPKGVGTGSNIFEIYLRSITANLYVLIFGLSPIVSISFFIALLFNLKKRLAYNNEARITLYFSLFILLYYFASTVNDVIATVRYQIIIYPFAFIIAAIGLNYLMSLPKVKKYLPSVVVYFLVITFSTLSLLIVRPFYFTYASSFLPKQYILNIKDMGDGSYEAAQFLNALPNARELNIWSDKGAVCAVFIGNCTTNFKKRDFINSDFDYFVLSMGRQSRTLKLSLGVNDHYDFKKAYETNETIFNLVLGDHPSNFVKIIDTNIIKK